VLSYLNLKLFVLKANLDGYTIEEDGVTPEIGNEDLDSAKVQDSITEGVADVVTDPEESSGTVDDTYKIESKF
jgi:hypothetical protein